MLFLWRISRTGVDILIEMDETDMQLVERYARDGSESAFAELVRRHLGLVYSAALRQVRSPELAEEVAQSVFLDLARGARNLSRKTVLAAWLYQVARRTAIDVIRRENRRQVREQVALHLTDMDTPSAEWRDLEPLLDEAMQSLDEMDRGAILLRYFENKSLREVGDAFGMSENAAQKRLGRAMERLHDFFNKRGASIGTSGLAALISANSVQAVPAGLGAAISSAVAQTITSSAITTTTITAMTTLQKSLIVVSLAAGIGTGVYQTGRATALQRELQSLEAKLPQVQDLEKLNRDYDQAREQIAALRAENDRLRVNTPELLRLRGDVTRLRAEAQAAAETETRDTALATAAKSWLERVDQLKLRLEQMPEAAIPEMQLLTEEDWLAAVRQPALSTDEDYRRAFASLRNTAQNKFAAIARPALDRYLKANNWSFPTDLAQLQPYFEPAPLDQAMLQRYALLPASSVPNVTMGGEWIITQKSPVDPEFDQRIVIGPNGHGSSSYPREELASEADLVTGADIETLTPALNAFSAAHNGQEPVHPAQLEPYITTAEQQTAFEKVMKARSQ